MTDSKDDVFHICAADGQFMKPIYLFSVKSRR